MEIINIAIRALIEFCFFNFYTPHKNGAEEGNRTLVVCLEGRCTTIVLLPLIAKKNGAEDEIRTRDPRLGKAMLYP